MEKPLSNCDFPSAHRAHICTSHHLRSLNRGSRRGTRMVGSSPDGYSAPMLVLCHVGVPGKATKMREYSASGMCS